MSIRLVPFADEHVPAFAITTVEPEIMRFTGVPVPAPDGWIQEWQKAYAAAADRENWAIIDDEYVEHGGFVGWGVAFHLDREAGSVELGYAVSPWARGRGVATEALRLLSAWALEQGLVRLVLQIQEENLASQGVARAVGYTYEGTQRSMPHKNDERVDLQLWSLLPGELD